MNMKRKVCVTRGKNSEGKKRRTAYNYKTKSIIFDQILLTKEEKCGILDTDTKYPHEKAKLAKASDAKLKGLNSFEEESKDKWQPAAELKRSLMYSGGRTTGSKGSSRQSYDKVSRLFLFA